jgi:ribonuclease VapC
MVIDTSAIFAAIAGEPDARIYRDAIKNAPTRLISAVTMLETRLVVFARLGEIAIVVLDELIDRAGIIVVPFDKPLVDAAFDAFRRYGKGQGNPAQLNIVDCAAYALARSRGLTLLFKGDDFARTDVASAIARDTSSDAPARHDSEGPTEKTPQRAISTGIFDSMMM